MRVKKKIYISQNEIKKNKQEENNNREERKIIPLDRTVYVWPEEKNLKEILNEKMLSALLKGDDDSIIKIIDTDITSYGIYCFPFFTEK